jgi:acylphosphatase
MPPGRYVPMDTNLQQLHATVRGRVQGVNFRAATQREAQRLKLAGWVRNRPDGSVEVLAEGPRPVLDQLMAFLHQGPPAAAVSEVSVEWLAAADLGRSFDVRW